MIDLRVPPGCARLILVRHAEPDEAMRGRCYGSLDVGLSAHGRAQAARLVAVLARGAIDAVYSSPRQRAIETVAGLAPPRVVADLREIDFGALEGMTYDEVAAAHPALYRRWMEQPTEVGFPGGEHYTDVRARVTAAAAAIRAAHPRGCALIVAHGGTLRVLLAEALRIADADIFRLDIAHASISVIDRFADGTPIVRGLNVQPALDLP
ncbi:MAG TPA: histidine phosphatase family protein [Kofleriaceae bacterium]|nr:histidine phosphatase family protein [Kofleriaceae bacterium]